MNTPSKILNSILTTRQAAVTKQQKKGTAKGAKK
jgi:hypothetical protein